MKRYIVYTANFGDYDELLDPAPSGDCDYICFTDNPDLTSRGWQLVPVTPWLTSAMMNRYFKILPHLSLSEYDASLYVDSNIEIRQDPYPLFDKYLKQGSFFSLKHHQRTGIVSEAISCVVNHKAAFPLVKSQITRYFRSGFKDDRGLTENRLLLRQHHSPCVRALMEDWWGEMQCEAQRDQLSLSYVCWKHDFRVEHLDENPILPNLFFLYHSHRASKHLKKNHAEMAKKLVRVFFYHCAFADIRIKFIFSRLVDNDS